MMWNGLQVMSANNHPLFCLTDIFTAVTVDLKLTALHSAVPHLTVLTLVSSVCD